MAYTTITAPGAVRIADWAQDVRERTDDETSRDDAIDGVLGVQYHELREELDFIELMAFVDDVTDHYDTKDAYETDQVNADPSDWRSNIVASYCWHIIYFALRKHLSEAPSRGSEEVSITIETDPLERFDEYASDAQARVDDLDPDSEYYDEQRRDCAIDAAFDADIRDESFIEQLYFLDVISHEYGVEGIDDTMTREALLAHDWRVGVIEAYFIDILEQAIVAHHGW